MIGRTHCLGAALVGLLAAGAQAVERVWIEGESCPNHTYNQHSWYAGGSDLNRMLMSPGVPEVSNGSLLGHYDTGNTPAEAHFTTTLTEGGRYTWWLRCNTFYAVQKYRIDSSSLWLPMNQDGREQVNIVKASIDIRFLGWIKVCVTNLNAGSHSFHVRVEPCNRPGSTETYGSIDCMCIANDAWAPGGAMSPTQDPAAGPSTWWAFRPGDDPLSPQSLTDMSYLLDKPAGRHGFLQTSGADFRFQDGTRVQFWGCGAGIASTATMDQQARFYAKYGIDLVRLHPVEAQVGVLKKNAQTGKRYLDPAALDVLDRWFATLKKQGIYSTWSMFYPHVVTVDDGYPAALYNELPASGAGKSTSGMVNFMPALQDAEWAFASILLCHTNAYTGLAYRDDPALAVVEAHNEDCIFWHAPLNDLANRGGPYPLHSAELRRLWMNWVASKYATNARLATAWGAGMHATDSVTNPNMDIYAAWEMAAAGPVNAIEKTRMGDFIHFLADTQRACYEQRRTRLRGLGFKGVFVTTAWQAGGAAANAANLYGDDAGDAIDRHAYAGGGAGNYAIALGAVDNQTHLTQPGKLLLSAAFQQVEDKPFTMSEWNMNPPTQWRAEAAPLYAFYGMGLHGWDACYHFTASKAWMKSGWPDLSSFVTETPLYMAQFPALAFAIYRGHIREAPIVACRRVTPTQIFRGYDALSQTLPETGYPGQNNLQTPDEVAAIGRITVKVADAPGASSKADWTQYWNASAKTITSVTGDLTWDYGKKVVLVKSAKTQGVIGWAGGATWTLPDVSVSVTTPFVVLLFTPLDDQPLRLSENILITALAQDKPWHAAYNAAGDTLTALGGPPLLLQPVQASLTFAGAGVASAKVVDIYGVPTARDVARAGNTITLGGDYRTYYYQVTRAPLLPPQVAKTAVSNAVPSFAFSALVPHTSYTIQRSTSLVARAFVNVTNISPTGTSASWSEPVPGRRAFYRLTRP